MRPLKHISKGVNQCTGVGMADPSFLFPYEEMERLAQDCASSVSRDEDSEFMQFKSLQIEARKCAKAVANTSRPQHEAAWQQLLPILDRMQKLLSQRGVDHKRAGADLPEWKPWWDSFSGTNRLTISFRTVQHRLNRFRGISNGENLHRARATRQEQLQLALTAKAGHRLAAVCKSGMGSVSEALAFYRESLALEKVEEITDRLSSPSLRSRPGGLSGLA